MLILAFLLQNNPTPIPAIDIEQSFKVKSVLLGSSIFLSCFLTSEFTEAFDFAGIEKTTYDKILSVKTAHSSIYLNTDESSDMINISKPYNESFSTWGIKNKRYPASLMYNDVMVSQVKEKYKRDIAFDDRVLDFGV